MGITQAYEFNEIMKSWKRTEPPGRPKQYSKYRELLDGAEEDIDPAIYCNRRSYIYKKTAEDLAKIFVGIRSDIMILNGKLACGRRTSSRSTRLTTTFNVQMIYVQ